MAHAEAARHAGDADKLRSLAYLYVANGKTTEARTCFALIARTREGLSAQDHYYLADIAQAQNNLQEAANELRLALHAKPEYLPAQLALGNVLLKLGDSAGARDAFGQALSIEPSQSDAVVGLAKLQLQAGEQDAAVRNLEDLMAAHPNSTAGAALLAPLLDRRGETDRAAAFRQISQQRPEPPPSDPWKQALLERCYNIQRLSLTFEDDFRNGRPDQGKPVLERLARLDPNSPTVVFFVGVSKAAAKHYDEAVTAFEAALSSGGDIEKICPQLVAAFVAQGKLAEAAATAHTYREKLPESLPIAKAYLNVALKQGDDTTARPLLEFVLKNEPLLKMENMALARILWESGDRDAAAECLKRVASIAPDDVPSRGLLAEYYLSKGNAGAAIVSAREALKYVAANSPEHQSLTASLVDAYAKKADAAAQAHQLPDAISALKELASLQPKNPTIFLTLGDMLQQQGERAQARQQWKRAEDLVAEGDSDLKRAISQRLAQ
ncbi:MAG TPA: tetratricopeptide repeat protein [Opitutaceae bacterium]|nr:tetratricopeptide repeat protein [Opitutaceae bacterium]